ncbi:MAG: TetR/AcrR family transcriptional regulator [Ilumatobacteraceae bacterium]
MGASRGTTVRLPRAQRRQLIVRAAAAVFLAGGYDKSSMEDVARAASVTRLIVYRIFESKEALYTAVLTSVLDDITTGFDHGGEGEAFAHRAEIAAILLGVARRQPDGFRLLWRHASNQGEFVDLIELFKSGATDYAIRLLAPVIPDPVIHRWAAESVVSHLFESVCLWLDNGDQTSDEVFVRMLMDGVRAMVQVWVMNAIDAGTARITEDATSTPGPPSNTTKTRRT